MNKNLREKNTRFHQEERALDEESSLREIFRKILLLYMNVHSLYTEISLFRWNYMYFYSSTFYVENYRFVIKVFVYYFQVRSSDACRCPDNQYE